MRSVTIRPTEPQAAFHSLTCKYPAFVGGFGTGKSETMANQAFMDASHGSDALIGLYEPTYDLIRLIMAPRMEEKLQQYGIRYKYNKSENIIYTSSPQFGDFILRTLDNPARIVGYETYRSHVDEIDTLKEDHAQEAWHKIIARNRQMPKGIPDPFNRVSAYTTPEGFRFVYRRWVKGANESYQMIQASTQSNPFLPADYVDSLRETYPPQLLSAYLEGQFVNLASGTVYQNYDRQKCRSAEQVVGNEPIYVGMDFNVTKMAATIYVIRGKEWHAVDEVSDGYDTPEMVTILSERYPSNKITVYPDASGKNRKSVGASISDISLLNCSFNVRVRTVNPMVKDRVMAVNAALSNGTLYINDAKCPNTADNLEQQVYDKNGQPDKSSNTDHQNDATGYPVAYEMPVRRPVANVKFKI